MEGRIRPSGLVFATCDLHVLFTAKCPVPRIMSDTDLLNEFKVSSGAHWKKTSEEFWEVTRSSLPSHSMFESEVLGHPPTLLTPFTEEDDWQPAEVRTAGGRTTQRLGPQLFPISKAGLKPQFQNKGT